jgi:3-oxoacyl-[acyl-carrier protein] reductase
MAKTVLITDRARLHAYAGDVRDGSRNRVIVDDVVDRFGALDALINNAGIGRDALLFNMSMEQWDEVVQANLGGAFSMIHAALPVMMKQRRGAIVNVSSVAGLRVVGQTNYSAAKGGLIAMTRSLAREIARSGVRINCVAPALVETDMIATLDGDVKRNLIHEVAMRRAIGADQVTADIAFLISDDASAITGQVLCIDGGVSA